MVVKDTDEIFKPLLKQLKSDWVESKDHCITHLKIALADYVGSMLLQFQEQQTYLCAMAQTIQPGDKYYNS
jgi:hypothetical protein